MLSLRDLMALRSLSREIPWNAAEVDSEAAGKVMRFVADELDRLGGVAGVTALVGELMGDQQAAGGGAPRATSPRNLLTGVPLAVGEAEGPVRILRDEADAGAVASGEIVVCAAVLPTWSSALERAAGLVVETGAVAAAPFRLARERGIPAVRLAGAAENLAGLPRVRVLGESGTIEILAPLPTPA